MDEDAQERYRRLSADHRLSTDMSPEQLEEELLKRREKRKKARRKNARMYFGWRVFVVISLYGYMFLMMMPKSMISILLPTFGEKKIYDHAAVSYLTSVSSYALAMGKFGSGILVKGLGARKTMVLLAGTAFVTVALFPAMINVPWAVVMWFFHNLAQAPAWTAVVATVATWFPYQYHSTVITFLATSFLIGEGVARVGIGLVAIKILKMNWRVMIWVVSLVCAYLSVHMWFVRSKPKSVGLVDEEDSPLVDDGIAEEVELAEVLNQEEPKMLAIVWKLAKSRRFYLVVVMNMVLGTMRELFRQWMPLFITSQSGGKITGADATIYSAIYPLAGSISAFSLGMLSDRLSGKRGPIMVACHIPIVIVLASFWMLTRQEGVEVWMLLGMTAIMGLCVIGPYCLLSGFSLDIGGKYGSGLMQGFQDTAGYLSSSLFSLLLGPPMKKAQDDNAKQKTVWSYVLLLFLALSIVSLLAAVLYSYFEFLAKRRATRRAQAAAMMQPLLQDEDQEMPSDIDGQE